MKRLLVGLFLVVSCLTGRMLGGAIAQESQDAVWTIHCEEGGNMAHAMAKKRDRGVPLETVLQSALEQPAPRDRLGRLIALQVYDQRDWTPEVARRQIELACFQEQLARAK
jgi:hypothetical protein